MEGKGEAVLNLFTGAHMLPPLIQLVQVRGGDLLEQ
jgi:hypothetical protein